MYDQRYKLNVYTKNLIYNKDKIKILIINYFELVYLHHQLMKVEHYKIKEV
jgi:hypothetical protein